MRGASPGNLLGVIGGMGVHATAYFYEMLMAMQHVNAEQEYLDVLIYSRPSIPDRTAFITGQSSESPIDMLKDSALTLARAGAGMIVMPCITAHYFYDDLAGVVDVPVINMMEEAAQYMAAAGYFKIGLLATDGTLRGGHFNRVLSKWDIEVVTPTPHSQAALMDIIYKIKRGDNVCHDKLEPIADELYKNGAKTVVLGCTELSMLQKGRKHYYIDTMTVLAQAALHRMC